MAGQLLSPLLGNHTITTRYGSKDAYSGALHDAIDWSAPEGTPVYAIADGFITKSDADDPLGGNIIRLTTTDGDLAGYAHLAERFVGKGQFVRAGQIIGTVGKTGEASTGAHLHFSLDVKGKRVNPLNYLSAITPASAYEQFVSLFDDQRKQVDYVLVKSGIKCPTGTQSHGGPYLGNPLPGFDACDVTNLGLLDAVYKTITKEGSGQSLAEAGIPVVSEIAGVGEFFGTLGAFLFDARNWLRLGALAGGTIMVAAGTIWVVKAT